MDARSSGSGGAAGSAVASGGRPGAAGKPTADAGGSMPSGGAGAGAGAGGSAGGRTPRPDAGAQPEAGTIMPVAALGVSTQHNDNARTGQNTSETLLTPANVDATHFGRKFAQPIDGYAYAQPLVALGVKVASGTRDLVYVATEHDSVYAFDADAEGPPVWKVSFLVGGATPVPPGDTGESADLVPEIGISGTPVLDPDTSTLYVVAKTKEPGPQYAYRLHALDLGTGAEKFGAPVAIQAQIKGTGADAVNGVVTFDALHDLQRPGLLLSSGIVYIAFGDHGDHFNWHGWVLGYDARTLSQKYVFCTTPDGNEASIWQSGAGLAADALGNVYLETGNGDFDGHMGGRDFGMTVVKLNRTAAVADWFTPFNYSSLSDGDLDLGSAGPLLLPDQGGSHPHVVLGSGKPGFVYVLDRDDMGHLHTGDDSQILQTVNVKQNRGGYQAGIFATPAYWNGRVYVGAVQDSLKAFAMSQGVMTSTPVSQSSHVFGFPGATISVTSNGTQAGIVWAVEGDGYTPQNPAVLHAYDATDLTKELYSTDKAPNGRDAAGPAVKFAVPTIVNGRVYLATQTELEVYGLL